MPTKCGNLRCAKRDRVLINHAGGSGLFYYSCPAGSADQFTFSFRRGLTTPIDVDLSELDEVKRVLQRSAGFGHNQGDEGR